ncbi:MAG TPA: metal ABC transporter permease [Opitutaceae bacterium]|nr:metal ABC transporter permease [Opitutaceae bacterium]
MIGSLIPAFDFERVIVEPWAGAASLYGWILLMGFLVTAACGLVGNYLILRRMALMGDAVSHSVLPGLVIAFLLTQSRGTLAMFAGALAAGAATTLLVEAIHRRSRVKQDSAIGITFTTLFAIGVVLISVYAQQVDLDAECVLYGEIAFVPLEPFATIGGVEVAPPSVLRMGGVLLAVVALVIVFYKELLVSSFDPGLAASLGINPTVMHYSLMAMLSIVIVSAFEAVGAILVVAMLILPGATAFLLTHRLWKAMVLSVAHAAVSALLGIHLAVWLDCSVAAAMVVMGSVLFGLAWVFAPEGGLIARALHARGIGRDKVGSEEEAA